MFSPHILLHLWPIEGFYVRFYVRERTETKWIFHETDFFRLSCLSIQQLQLIDDLPPQQCNAAFRASFRAYDGHNIMINPVHNGALETKAVRIPAGGVLLNADLTMPAGAKAIIAFAHGSGSSRHSTRNRYVAETLNGYKFATLLADLLTEEEETIDMRTRHLRFDIPMLADRLIDIAAWLQSEPQMRHLKIGWFGASTGAGAALIAAARRPENIMAVVSRGGRPDLAGDYLPEVAAPVLLIVGENDPQVLELNKSALARLNTEAKLEIVPNATHLFEEPGTLEAAALLAAQWFEGHSD